MKKILIADELSFCRQLFSFALSRNGYDVVEAEDGLGAIDAVKKEKPDLIMLEAKLPKMDGIGVLRIVRAMSEFKAVPVFMLTAVENRAHVVQAVQIGVQEYILKSKFDLDTLLVRIKKCIGGRGGAPAIEEVWEDVAAPCSGVAAIEIAGDMEAEFSAPKLR